MSILTCFFLALIPYYAASITFNFPNITPNNSHDIILSGDAYTTDDGIQVTYKKINRSWEGLAGRATYVKPLHLWDNNSRDLSSFSTSFTFVTASYKINENIYGDGLTFFLGQNNSVINAGGSIGLPFDFRNNTSLYPFVSVEFDTFGTDVWDPKEPGTDSFVKDHVGININSLTSVAYRKWLPNINESGKECRALISYDSDSKNLSVSFTTFKDEIESWDTGLDYTIDLRDVLPEWVIFGFSASTGDQFEKNNVRSWTFNSTEIKGGEYNGLAPTENIDQSINQPPNKNSDQGNNPPTKNYDQSSSLRPTTSKNVGKVGLIAGTLVLVYHSMALL